MALSHYSWSNDYECPKCGEWISVGENTQDKFECPWCNSRLLFDPDGEYVNGSWRDLSKLIKYEPPNPVS